VQRNLEQLLRSFEQPELEEIVLASDAPAAAISAKGANGGLNAPDAWDTDAILAALVAFGGSRHVEELSSSPKQWTARVPGIGMIAISVKQVDASVEARFRLMKKAGKSIPPAEIKPMKAPVRESAFPVLTGPPPFAAKPRAQKGPLLRLDTPTQAQVKAPVEEEELEELEPMPSIELEHGRDDTIPHRRAPAVMPGEVPPPPPPHHHPPPAPLPALPSVMVAPELLDLPPLPPLPPLRPAAPAPASLELLSLPPLPPPPPPPPPPQQLQRGRPGSLPPPPPKSKPSLPPPPQKQERTASIAPKGATGLAGLLAKARDRGASDLHVVAARPPRYRVGGELREGGGVISAEEVERMVLPLVPDHLMGALADDGSCDFAYADVSHGRFRVNVSRQQTGYKACFRLIALELPTIASLRLPPGIAAGARHHQGLIVFTGPTGHGKTTTMNAIVDFINESTSHHIITVEDPVEHVHPKKKALMSQREVGTHTASFARALKASLREDPDVIVVGELRDVETVRMAVSASETGHLVLGTMNTPSAARTLDRLIDLFPVGDQPQVRLTLAAGLRLIVGQRLVPGNDGVSMHAAYEVLPGSVPLSALIRDAKTFQIPSLQQRGKALGIVRLDESLARLVVDERVTLAAAKAVAEAPLELDSAIRALSAGP
jgi:twitching motility protein PilT